jgi:hypothetical protein
MNDTETQISETTDNPVTPTDDSVQPEQAIEAQTDTQEAVQTFDAEYVKSLRAEAAEYRVKAKRADALAKQALTALVKADGRLIDPSDMEFSEDLLSKDGTVDAQALEAALDALIDAKPHLARKRPTAPLAQGVRAHKSEPNLLQLIQAAT